MWKISSNPTKYVQWFSMGQEEGSNKIKISGTGCLKYEVTTLWNSWDLHLKSWTYTSLKNHN